MVSGFAGSDASGRGGGGSSAARGMTYVTRIKGSRGSKRTIGIPKVYSHFQGIMPNRQKRNNGHMERLVLISQECEDQHSKRRDMANQF